ncbi:MAG: universal stress protein [Nitrospirota bacterium]|nr:universal stress protein [Nitrospirota bacterium]
MKIMVAYDGTVQAKEALVYGMKKAVEKGGEVVALHVFNAPQFIDYDVTPNAISAARAEAARFVAEAKTIIAEKGNGATASLFSTDGNPNEAVIDFARAEKVDVLLCPPAFRSIVNKYRKALGDSEFAKEAGTLDLAAVTVTK